MNEYLKTYQMKLTAIGPVYVGSGREINKKEYMFYKSKTLGVVNTYKLYSYLQNKGLASEYETYLLDNNKLGLKAWLAKHQIEPEDVVDCIRYQVDCGDALEEGGNRLQISECVKDAYHMPYIPGSSIKGMLRTILLAYEIQKNKSAYSGMKQTMKYNLSDGKGRNILKREIGQMETIAFHTLKNEKRKEDALNDNMSGLQVSDSEPLEVKDLVLCQKIDIMPDGTTNKLNILRESVKPGTEIIFSISIDSTRCPYTIEDIMEAIQSFGQMYYDNFLSTFQKFTRPAADTVYLGGGAGFATKTIDYPLYGDDALEIIKEIFDKTLSPKAKREHKHYLDHRYGVSPHMVKCTKYGGQILQMGMCKCTYQKLS